ncbi:glutamate receptor ionotropic, delta-1-like [Diachasmimorpha longicaudata]|uniref:glutamate receptor ionotropic, delta-1-like n=1 Tax=Diachasmimorpha longicaudata TaxID=58733 RepID=UPI0030B8AD64
MRGTELMMMGISALGIVTDSANNGTVIQNPYEWENSAEYFKVSLADVAPVSVVGEPAPPVIKVATLETPPYSATIEKNGSLRGEGYAFEVLDLIAKKLNVSYEIIKPKTPGLGDETSGLIELLKNKDIDIAVAFIPMLWRFTEFTRYSPIMDEAHIVGMMVRPAESASGSGLLAPFDTSVWMCILISSAAIGPTIYLFTSFR